MKSSPIGPHRPSPALLVLLFLAGACAAPLAAAQSSGAPLYTVEVVVFRAASAPLGEDWSVHPPGRGFGANPGHSGATPELVRVLPASEYRLAGIDTRLRTSGTWRVIAHAAWTQTAGTWGAHLGLPLADVGINLPELQGTVYLERAPIYLHLGFDVGLHVGAATYWIDEMRSIKYGDKLYFDNPGLGLIAEVTPVKRTP